MCPVPVVFACRTETPLLVPALRPRSGVKADVCSFAGFGRMVKDPRAEVRKIAEVRARRRLLHPFGGGDAETEYRQQWRRRWVFPIAAVDTAPGSSVRGFT